MASVRAQLEELKKPHPRYVLELHTIRGMTQEADNMAKSLRAGLGIRMQVPMMPSGGILSVAATAVAEEAETRLGRTTQ